MAQSEALKEVEEFRRNKLRELLAQCEPGQQEVFGRMYPEGVDEMPVDKLDWATQQCENTIRKNLKKAAGGS